MKRVYNSLRHKNVHAMCIAVENVKIIANGIYYKKKITSLHLYHKHVHQWENQWTVFFQ